MWWIRPYIPSGRECIMWVLRYDLLTQQPFWCHLSKYNFVVVLRFRFGPVRTCRFVVLLFPLFYDISLHATHYCFSSTTYPYTRHCTYFFCRLIRWNTRTVPIRKTDWRGSSFVHRQSHRRINIAPRSILGTWCCPPRVVPAVVRQTTQETPPVPVARSWTGCRTSTSAPNMICCGKIVVPSRMIYAYDWASMNTISPRGFIICRRSCGRKRQNRHPKIIYCITQWRHVCAFAYGPRWNSNWEQLLRM